MSKVIKRYENRLLGHLVMTDDGNYFYVDSCIVFDNQLETMVFSADKYGKVTDWLDLYCQHHFDIYTMIEEHEYIIENLEEVLGGK